MEEGHGGQSVEIALHEIRNQKNDLGDEEHFEEDGDQCQSQDGHSETEGTSDVAGLVGRRNADEKELAQFRTQKNLQFLLIGVICALVLVGIVSVIEWGRNAATDKLIVPKHPVQCAASSYKAVGESAAWTTSGCEPCASGRYSDDLGATSCAACKQGLSTSLGKGTSSNCAKCPTGKFTHTSVLGLPLFTTCWACTAGKYNEKAGSTECSWCPVGSTALLGEGASAAACVTKVEEVIKSESDTFEYRTLRLANGMSVVLVHDGDADKSAAALSVGVGSLNEGKATLGLAHFCEHMLFLGNEKYPIADQYQKEVASHGGYTNAFTDNEETNFYFEIDKDYLEQILDRFANFFISPLLTPASAYKEMRAVNSEYRNDISNDGWRQYQLLKTMANPSHPFSRFSIGEAHSSPVRSSM
jgi:hypothetical protein